MAYHILSLFLRDPVPAYENELDFKNISLPCDNLSQDSTDEECKQVYHDWFTKRLESDDISHFENI